MPTHGKFKEFDQTLESWTSYTERLNHYFKANDTPNNKQKSILLTVIGPATYSLAKSLSQTEGLDAKSFKDIVKLLEEHYCPKQSQIIQRYKFNTRVRQPGETIAQYVAHLRSVGEHCSFHDLEEMLRDRLVCGVNEPATPHRLLQEPELTFKKAYDISIAMESASKDIHDIQHRPSNQPKPISVQNAVQKVTSKPCYRCGGKTHSSTVCRFKDATCHHCGKKGHIDRACLSKQKKLAQSRKDSPKHLQKHSVKTVEAGLQLDLTSDSSEKTFTVFSLNHNHPPITTTLLVNNHSLELEVDTGASLSPY